MAVHDHAERIADQQKIDMGVDQPRGVRVIGSQRDDLLAALPGPDIGCGEPAHFQVL